MVQQPAHKGITVILGSRDLQKGEWVAAHLIDAGLQIVLRQLDAQDKSQQIYVLGFFPFVFIAG